MIQDIRNLGLGKRIGIYHVLFSAIAVGTTAVGMTLNHFSQEVSRQEHRCLPILERSVPKLRIDIIRNEGSGTQAFIETLQRENHLLFASVVSQDGKFFAHSNSKLVGSSPVEVSGTYRVKGEVSEIRFENGSGQLIREWRTPIETGDFVGEVRIGTAGKSFLGYLFDFDGALLSFLLPMVAVGAGAIVLRRLTHSLSQVESQLIQVARAPIGKPRVDAIPLSSATSHGWNRVVSELTDHKDVLSEKLEAAFGSRESEHWEAIVNAFPLGVAVTDATGRVLKSNRNFQAYCVGIDESADNAALEFKSAELVSRESSRLSIQDCLAAPEPSSLADGQAAEARRAVWDQVDGILRETPTRPFSVELKQGDREVRAERSRQLQANTAAGQFVWTIRDITQQRMSDRLHTQFVDAATHELRTPLANIKAYAETLALEDGVQVEEQKEFCNIISAEATRLARFIDDLLDVRSLEVGSMMIQRQNVELERLLNDAVDKVRPLMDKNDLKFIVKLPAKLSEISVDKDKLFGVLVNLLGNAAKYTPSGGEVEMQVVLENDQLEIAVRDSGSESRPRKSKRSSISSIAVKTNVFETKWEPGWDSPSPKRLLNYTMAP